MSRFAAVNRRDATAGVLTIVTAVLFIEQAAQYRMGTLFRMGPGLFPIVLGSLLGLLGLALVAQSFRGGAGEPADLRWRPLVMIAIGVLLFAAFIERLGLAPATLALVLASSFSEPVFRPLRALILAIAIFALVYGIFVLMLGMQLRAFRW